MFYSAQRRSTLTRGILSLWVVWVIAVGCLLVLDLSAPIITPRFVPVLAVLLQILLIYLDRRNSSSKNPVCLRMIFIAEWIMFYSAIALVLIILYISKEGAIEITGQPVNLNNPMIPVLVTSPTAALVSLYFLIRKQSSGYCSSCPNRRSIVAETGIMSRLFYRESLFQTRALFLIAALVAVVTWTYYFTRFINVNINSGDKYVFIVFPSAMILLSIIYLGVRYYSIWLYYCHNNATARILSHSGTEIRFLIINDEKVLLGAPKSGGGLLSTDDLKIDVPLKISINYREKMPLHEAAAYFARATGDSPAEIKPVYESHDVGMYRNIFHFAAFVDNPDEVAEKLKGSWLTIPEVGEMIRANIVTATFAAEFRRIYKVTMAWKTYDRRGFRLYDIKHYRPTFRLRDIRKAVADYNDPAWLRVARLSQDKHFFRIRRLWRKLIRGNA